MWVFSLLCGHSRFSNGPPGCLDRQVDRSTQGPPPLFLKVMGSYSVLAQGALGWGVNVHPLPLRSSPSHPVSDLDVYTYELMHRTGHVWFDGAWVTADRLLDVHMYDHMRHV